MPLAAIRKSQARQYRQALQDVPIKRFRTGKLRTATLPELADWGRAHANAQKIGAGTINKLLGALQSVCRWARKEKSLCPMIGPTRLLICAWGGTKKRAHFKFRSFRQSSVPLCSLKATALKAGRVRRHSGYRRWRCLLVRVLGSLRAFRVSDVVQDASVGTVSVHTLRDAKIGGPTKDQTVRQSRSCARTTNRAWVP